MRKSSFDTTFHSIKFTGKKPDVKDKKKSRLPNKSNISNLVKNPDLNKELATFC